MLQVLQSPDKDTEPSQWRRFLPLVRGEAIFTSETSTVRRRDFRKAHLAFFGKDDEMVQEEPRDRSSTVG